MMLHLAFRNLFRNLRRTVAVLLTVGIGAGALFSFDGFINGVLGEYRNNTIHAHSAYGQINTVGYLNTVFENPTSHWIENGDELTAFLLAQPEVKNVFPRASFSALLKNGNTTVSGLGQGIDAEKEASFFTALNVEQGQMLTNQSNGIMLGSGLAKALGVAPGDTITVMATSTKSIINKKDFVVVGIFHTGLVDFDNRTFRIQLDQAQALLKTHRIESVAIDMKDFSKWDELAAQVKTHFPDLEMTSFAVLDKVYYQNSVDWLNAQFRVVQVIILAIVLLGIFNTISTSILERKQEIGNLRANGESVYQVMQLFLTEGVLLAVIGSLFGMALCAIILTLFVNNGIAMPPGPGMTRQFLVTFSYHWSVVVKTMLLCILAALIASFFAGIRVAKMSIASALKSY
jgi:putative ABC transport system permease protein